MDLVKTLLTVSVCLGIGWAISKIILHGLNTL